MGEPDTGPEQLHEERPRNLPSLAETHLESKPYYREFGDGLSQFGARRRVEGGDFVGKKMLENFNTARVALSSRKCNKNSRNSRKLTYFEKRIWTNLRSMHRILQSTTFLPNRITERQSPEPCSDEQTAGYDTANFPSNGLERLLRKCSVIGPGCGQRFVQLHNFTRLGRTQLRPFRWCFSRHQLNLGLATPQCTFSGPFFQEESPRRRFFPVSMAPPAS